MAKKTKKSDIQTIVNSCVCEDKTLTYTDESGKEVVVKVFGKVGFDNKISAMEGARRILFLSNGSCYPELRSFAFGYALVRCFTDIQSTDAIALFDLVMNSNIVQNITAALSEMAYDNFCIDFENMVDFYNNFAIARYAKMQNLDNLAGAISGLMDNAGESFEKIAEKIANTDEEKIIEVLADVAK